MTDSLIDRLSIRLHLMCYIWYLIMQLGQGHMRLSNQCRAAFTAIPSRIALMKWWRSNFIIFF